MRHKKLHVKAVGDVIEQHLEAQLEDGEPLDIDELAKACIEAYREVYDREPAYVGVARLPIGEDAQVYRAFGPFTTAGQAGKALSKLTAAGPVPGHGRVIQVTSGVPV